MKKREIGTVKWFNPYRGYGFITRDEQDDVFVHVSSVKAKRNRTLHQGQQVEFSLAHGCAAQVIKLDPDDSFRQHAKAQAFPRYF